MRPLEIAAVLWAVLTLLLPPVLERNVSAAAGEVWPYYTAGLALLGLTSLVLVMAGRGILGRTRIMYATAAVGVVGGSLLAGVYAWARHREDTRAKTEGRLPVDIQSLAGLHASPGETATEVGTSEVLQGLVFRVSLVQITNQSSRSVNLVFHLQVKIIKNEKGREHYRGGCLVSDPPTFDQPDPPTTGDPLTIPPEETKRFAVVMPVVPGIEQRVWGRMQLDPAGGHILTVTDLVSGKVAEMEIPTASGLPAIRIR
jgi:hypothetical protein